MTDISASEPLGSLNADGLNRRPSYTASKSSQISMVNESKSYLLSSPNAPQYNTNAVENVLGTLWVYNYSEKYRWFMILFCCLCVFSCGPSFLNSGPLGNVLTKQGAYAWQCSPGDEPIANSSFLCKAQQESINIIFNSTTTAMFAFSFLGGILLDALGAKITGLIGILLQGIGWLLIALSKETRNMYLIGFLFLAAGVDPAFFGILSCTNLFPGWVSVGISIVGASRSMSFVVFFVFEKLYGKSGANLLSMSLGMVVLMFFWGLVVAFYIPFQPYPKLPEGVGLIKENDGYDYPTLSTLVNKKPSSPEGGVWAAVKKNTSEFLPYVISLQYVPLVFCATVTLVRLITFATFQDVIFSKMANTNAILGPLAFIPCIFNGYIANRFSASLVIGYSAVLGGLSIILGLTNSIFPEIIILICNWFFLSFIASQIFCFVSYAYPQSVSGRLAGFALCVGSLLSAILMLVDSKLRNIKTTWFIIVTCLGFMSAGAAVYLYYASEKPNRKKILLGRSNSKKDDNFV